MARPCFFFSAPDIAPRTLCVCQSRDLLICSTVAPSGRRRIASSWASLVLDLDAACLRVFALVVGAAVETLVFLLIMDSFTLHPAGVVAGAPCIRFRCPHVQVEAQIMPLLSLLPVSHSMAGPLAYPRQRLRRAPLMAEARVRIP